MPQAIAFTLRPVRRASVAASLGGPAHAAILEQIAARDATLAAAIHGDQRGRPLTVALLGLQPDGLRASVTPEHTYTLRVTALSAPLEELVAAWTPATLPQLALGGLLWRVEQVATTSQQHRLAGSASYAQLLGGAQPADRPRPLARWRFSFTTPVMFRQRNRCLPLPAPELVFGSLLERWNVLAPLPLVEEAREFAARSLVVNDFELRSVASAGKGGVPQIGAVGVCSYTATSRDPYLERCLDVLARFAAYSGVGAGTARGFGQASCLLAGRVAGGQAHHEATRHGA